MSTTETACDSKKPELRNLVEEIREKRNEFTRNLDRMIYTMVEEFNDDTGLKIKDIRLNFVDVSVMGHAEKFYQFTGAHVEIAFD